MSHEIEVDDDGRARFFAVGEAAWHGLGTVLDAPPTVEEAIRLAGLDWEVATKQLAIMETAEEVDAYATVRTSDGKILGVVGPDYMPLQNREAFAWFNPFLQAGDATLETAGSLRAGKRVFVLAKISREPLAIVPAAGDIVQRYILLSNSHDGTMAVRAGFVDIRVVCANTLASAHSDRASKLLRIKHTAGLRDTLDGIRDVMSVANREFLATVEQYRWLATRDIAPDDLRRYVKSVFTPGSDPGGGPPAGGADPGGDGGVPPAPDFDNEGPSTGGAEASAKPASGVGERLYERIVPLFEGGRGNDLPGVKGTWWAAFNGVTEYLTHERGKSADTRLDSLWFGQGAQLGRRALDTALAMAR